MCQAQQDQLDILAAQWREERNILFQELARLDSYVDERLYLASSASLSLKPQSSNVEKITSMLAVVTNGPATLTIDDRTFTLPQGITYWNNLTWIVKPGASRTLTQASPGLLSLELMGVEIPNRRVW